MEKEYCEVHEREACVVDLNLSKLLCQKCALFDPAYKHHQFIDLATLPSYSEDLYKKFKAEIQALNINVNKDAVSKWKTVDELAKTELTAKLKEINAMYDEMVAEIERQRKEKISSMAEQIQKIVQESNESVDLIVGDKYHQLYCKNKYLLQCLQKQMYLDVSRQLLENSTQQIIQCVEKDLSIIQLDIKQKLKMVDEPPVPTINDFSRRRRTSVRQELLISNQPSHFVQFSSPQWKTQRPSVEEKEQEEEKPIKERLTLRNPETERLSTIHSIDLSMTSSEIDLKRKNSKKVMSKADIKSLVLKSSVKEVEMTDLNLNNRQALQAIKKCTSNTFVTTIDLSNNPLSSQLVLMLKRQRGLGKSLKKVVLRGAKINEAALKKEGVSTQMLKEGKVKIGEISIVV